MSTSVTNRTLLKIAFTYLLISIFVALFGGIYEVFSHGVYSNYMIYAFSFPLVGGCVPFFILGMWSHIGGSTHPLYLKPPGALSCNLYHSGIATLTAGSIIHGVLEIYGTTSYLSKVYWIVGIPLILAGIITYIIKKVGD